MLKKVLLGLVALVAVFAIVVATRPAEFRIERSTQINAPADVVFAQVNNFRNWDAWSPWAKLDPHMVQKIDGPPQGLGATYFWSGDQNVGEGRMVITESKPNEKIGIKLEFLKPWEATNAASFVFAPRGQQTTVTWVMEGRNTFTAKAVGMFMDVDAMIGAYFEQGLAQMKTIAEAEQQKRVAAGGAFPELPGAVREAQEIVTPSPRLAACRRPAAPPTNQARAMTKAAVAGSFRSPWRCAGAPRAAAELRSSMAA